MLISIVIPVYNGENYLSQSIESCLNQTYKNLELIIVNDCSTDGTLNIAKHYAKIDSRIIIINNEENKKLPASLNIGHNKAKGEFITWISDDNIFKSNFLEVHFKNLIKQQSDVVYSDYDIIYCDGALKRKQIAGPAEHLLYGNIIGASFLYRKKVFQELKGFNESLYLLEDYDFWLRASLKFKLFHIEENLYQYRLHSNSLTSEIQNNILLNSIYQDSVIKMFNEMVSELHWNKATHNLLINHFLGKPIVISNYLRNKRTIYGDVLKFNSKEFNNSIVINGLLFILRNELISNKQNQNIKMLINVLRNERLLLFHKSYSKKVTFNFIKNCII